MCERSLPPTVGCSPAQYSIDKFSREVTNIQIDSEPCIGD